MGLIFPDRGPSLLPLVPRSFIESVLLSRPIAVVIWRTLSLSSRSLIESAIVVDITSAVKKSY